MTLFDHPISSSSRRASATAAHRGMEREHRIIDLGTPEDRVAARPRANVEAVRDRWRSGSRAQRALREVRSPGGGVLDEQLARRLWISGSGLTLAEISVGATLRFVKPTKLAIAGSPNGLALVERVHALAAWKAADPARWT